MLLPWSQRGACGPGRVGGARGDTRRDLKPNRGGPMLSQEDRPALLAAVLYSFSVVLCGVKLCMCGSSQGGEVSSLGRGTV